MRLIHGAMKETNVSNREGWSFGLTIRFGIEPFKFFTLGMIPRSMTLAITEATVVFDLEEATMPDEDWAFDDPPPSSLEISREVLKEETGDQLQERTDASERNSSASGEAQASPKLSFSTALKQAGSKKSSQTRRARKQSVEKYVHTQHMITSSGGSDDPSWTIAALIEGQILKGPAIKANYFARVLPKGQNASVSMKAVIPEHAIRIQDDTGAFKHVNRRLLALRRIKKALCDQPISLQDVEIVGEARKIE